ncbi:uncharacterized protein K452DRAFT_307727 [Aplosporella prunicola CBS 121167]|uniref:Uncharacterized protein n=1 Tax=Aplosporella prunicola CBS 121167 TaxID=1176127 RepID=A0A6A6BJR4_9PEZI|nr:uncharacterized protein K452DRAFT_307727 [Aplosporella prunicola CBS 121167]KAF2142811.1 hypothetical protein K452DRAFT_307727 [Aplosporella prunicola CBS 121167]
MVAIKSIAISIISVIGLMQMCPAPAAIAGAVARTAVSAGARSAAKGAANAGKEAAKDAAKGAATDAATDAIDNKLDDSDDSESSKRRVRRADFLNDLRARSLPAGVSQQSFDTCVQQIVDQHSKQGISVQVYTTGNSNSTATASVRADNVPAACMNLATVLSGNPTQQGGAIPIPMGSSSLEYLNLSKAEFKELKSALKAS